MSSKRRSATRILLLSLPFITIIPFCGIPVVVADGLRVELQPEETTVGIGETLSYTVTVINDGGETVEYDGWTELYLPNGQPYPGNPFLGPVPVVLETGDSLSRQFSHEVLPIAPTGPYEYWCKVGSYPWFKAAQDSFAFEVIPEFPRRLWDLTLESTSFGGGAVGDIDKDGKPEIVFGTYFGDEHLYALNAEDGSILWKFYDLGGPMDASVTIADVDLDGDPEIVSASSWGILFCLDGAGELEWRFPETGYINCTDSPPAVEDMDGDGKPEIVFGAWGGDLYVLNGEDGSVVWNANYGSENYIQSQPAILDIDGIGGPDIVFGTWGDNKVYAVSGDGGAVIWTYPTGDYIYHGPSFADIDDDGLNELVVGGYDGYIRALNAEDGSLLWSYHEGSAPYAPVAIADLDNEPGYEIVGASSKLVVLSSEGELLWEYPTGGSIFRGAAVADTDGDGWLDLVFGSSDCKLRAVRGLDGALLWDYSSGSGYSIDHHPVIHDFDGDGTLDVFFVGGGDYNNRYGRAYAIQAGPGTGPGWPMFMHDHRHSGCFDGYE